MRAVGRLEGVELRRLRLPLVEPWRTALGTVTDRDVLLVRAVFAETEGWAECVAMNEPTYSPEYVDGAVDVMRRHLLPRLLAAAPAEAASVAAALAAVKGHPMAKAALELAWLDAEGRRDQESLAHRLGGTRSRPRRSSRRRHRVGRGAARRGRPADGRGLPPGQAQDPSGLGRRAGRGGQGPLRR